MLKGPSNSDALLQSLTGKTVKGVFRDDDEGNIYLVVDDGSALCFSHTATWWREDAENVRIHADQKMRAIRTLLDEINGLEGLIAILHGKETP